jgi:hypothetical protein
VQTGGCATEGLKLSIDRYELKRRGKEELEDNLNITVRYTDTVLKWNFEIKASRHRQKPDLVLKKKKKNAASLSACKRGVESRLVFSC